MKFAHGGVVHARPVGGGEWTEIGTVGGFEPDSGSLMPIAQAPWVRLTDDVLESYTRTIKRNYTHTVEFTAKKLNRRVVELLLGVRLPRSARSLRRRRAKLNRKRRMRKRR